LEPPPALGAHLLVSALSKPPPARVRLSSAYVESWPSAAAHRVRFGSGIKWTRSSTPAFRRLLLSAGAHLPQASTPPRAACAKGNGSTDHGLGAHCGQEADSQSPSSSECPTGKQAAEAVHLHAGEIATASFCRLGLRQHSLMRNDSNSEGLNCAGDSLGGC
jgi:hypothetical protein